MTQLYDLTEIKRGKRLLKMTDVMTKVKKKLVILRNSHRGEHGIDWEITPTESNKRYAHVSKDQKRGGNGVFPSSSTGRWKAKNVK